MGISTLLITLLLMAGVVGCSSISLPSLPSMPWSGSAPKADPTVEALFEEGNQHFKDKKFVRAIDAFTRIKTDHPFSPLVTAAELKIADAYYLNKQYPEAIAALKEFQSLHPTNENIPFVIYRLGLAHFEQFTSTDREQKNTVIAKSYFETVITNHPKSPYALEAKDKLAKCNGILAEHNFNIALFYFNQEKYPAARDRFEEIVRAYRGTPVAGRSLYFLGESYRREKNFVKASLAYEAVMEHYPETQFAADARTQLAQLDKQKQDPLAMLLMRDRRPTVAIASQSTQGTPGEAKPKEVNNLVAKTEVVYEAPGAEKNIFRRVVDKINPFSGSDDEKKEPTEKKPESGVAILAKRKAAEKEESKGFFSWLNPFASSEAQAKKPSDGADSDQVVAQIDESLKEKGFNVNDGQSAALKPPPAALPKVENTPPPPPADTSKLLSKIDATLSKDGNSAGELPPPPEAAAIFETVAVKKAPTKAEPPPSIATSGLLTSIDQKLKSKGVDPGKIEVPVPSNETGETEPKTVKKVELAPRVAVEKGPLFAAPTELPNQVKPAENQEPVKEEKKAEGSDKPQEPKVREVPKAVVQGPGRQPEAIKPAAKPTAQKPGLPGEEEQARDVLDQLREDVDAIGKVLNPFQW